jgi:hypothetical protein
MNQLSVPESPQMQFLLKDKSLLRQIARAMPSIDLILFQINLDVATPENAANLGHDILALKRLRDIFLMFSLGGEILLKEDQNNQK